MRSKYLPVSVQGKVSFAGLRTQAAGQERPVAKHCSKVRHLADWNCRGKLLCGAVALMVTCFFVAVVSILVMK